MSLKDSISCAQDVVSAAIASGTSLSNAVNLGGLRLFGIVMPSAWNAADLSFQASMNNGTIWNDVYDGNVLTGGSEYIISAAASRYIVLDPTAFCTITTIRIRSGTAGTPIIQTADRSLQLILRSY